MATWTLGKINEKYETLKSVADKILPRKVTTAIARNVLTLEKEIKFFSEQRMDIVNRFCEKTETGELNVVDGQYVFGSDENKYAFVEEMKQLNETAVDVEIMKFHVSELERCDVIDKYDALTPREEASLEWMIDYE